MVLVPLPDGVRPAPLRVPDHPAELPALPLPHDEDEDEPLLQDGRQHEARGALRKALQHRGLVRALPDEQKHEHEVKFVRCGKKEGIE